MRRFCQFFVFITSLSLPLIGQSANVLPTALKAPAVEYSLPHPSQLKADWWEYFVHKPEQQSQRLERFKEQLSRLREPLIQTGDQHRLGLLDNALAALGFYRQLLQHSVPEASPPLPEPRNRYSMAELLALHQLAVDSQQRLSNLKEQWQRIQSQEKNARKKLETDKAAYLSLEDESSERLSQGLMLVSARFEVESLALRALHLKQQFEVEQQRLQGLQKGLEAALPNVVVGEDEQQNWQRQLQRWQQDEQQARKQLQKLLTRPSQNGMQGELALANVEMELAAIEHRRLQTQLMLLYFQQPPANVEAMAALKDQLKEENRKLGAELVRWNTLLRQAGADNQTLKRLERLAALEASRMDAELLIRMVEGWITAEQQGFNGQLQRFWSGLKVAAALVYAWFSASLFSINETPVTPFGVLRVLLILLLTWHLAKLPQRALARFWGHRPNVNQASMYTLGKVLHHAIMLFGTFVALSSLGLDLSNLALVASALSIGIGFGLQAMVSNFIAGMILLFERSLKVGDYVELESGVTGEVKQINIRSTVVTTNDNVDIVIPNSEFVNGRVTNWTMNDEQRRILVPFRVAYGEDKERVRQAGLEAAEAVSFTLRNHPGRHPQVWMTGFGEYGMEFKLIVWLTPEGVKRPGQVNASYTWELESSLRRHGIRIPLPQRELWLHREPAAEGQEAAD